MPDQDGDPRRPCDHWQVSYTATALGNPVSGVQRIRGCIARPPLAVQAWFRLSAYARIELSDFHGCELADFKMHSAHPIRTVSPA